MSEQNFPKVLVTGAAGHLGQRVLELLLEQYQGPIIAATRTPEKLSAFAARGVTVRFADFDRPDSLATAFADVDRILLISTDALDRPGRRLAQHQQAVASAQQAGVKHVVYTSISNPEPGAHAAVAADHYGTEQALAKSTLGWTVLRNNLYAEQLVQSLTVAIQSGTLFSAAGDGRAAYVTREDCARAAAAALIAPFDGRRTLDVTGPEALSQADIAAIASTLSGKAVVYVPLTHEQLVQGLAANGLPPPIADLIASFDAAIAHGELASISPTVTELTGKPPQRIEAYLLQQRDAILAQA